MNLSFAGCGFLGIYHVGVAVCFKKYAPHLLLDKISGASAGALAAVGLLCDLPLGEMTSEMLRVGTEARSHCLGPFSPSFNIQKCLLDGIEKFLPADAHLRVNGRLHVSLTRVYDGKNVIVSHFNSREDLSQALLCACFIPVFSGILPPRFHGVRYMDGGFSDNLPTIDENTITVSPFCGESDICPRDKSSQLFHINFANTSIELSRQNMNRFGCVLMPPRPEILSNMCQQGFDDALRFLQRNNLISCTRCLSVQSTFIIQESITDIQDYDPECKDCTEHRQDASKANLPDTVVTVLQAAMETANKGITNWLFRHRGAKLLHTLSLPATLPADFICATLTKLLLTTNRIVSIVGDTLEKRYFRMRVVANVTQSRSFSHHDWAKDETRIRSELKRIMTTAPGIRNKLWNVSKYVLGQLNSTLNPIKQKNVTANLSCQLSLTEYGQLKNAGFGGYHQRTSRLDLLLNENKKNRDSIVPDQQDLLAAGDNDTFENILQVSSQQDSVYAYYYMDENNKVKVTEIFDMSEVENPSVQTASERETNMQLEFDNDWDCDQSDFFYGDVSTEPFSYSNAIEMPDDNDNFLYDIPNKDLSITDVTDEMSSDTSETYLQPEADQPNILSESASNALARAQHSILEL